ncbi:MAG: serine/threonine protein kinase [Cyanosarcina radialis HA8281-LM2]|jgi:serine/threonine protein kinase|nr:serine/threonine protein kinase [Cyanosarcina radialis HA8281-LM2]
MNTTTRPVLKNGQYILKNRLRKGIFSVTYRATDSQSGQTVAIKTLNDRLPQQRNLTRFKQQFLLTAQKLAAIEHPHLARVLDYFEEGEKPYLVMAYLPGQTLEELVSTPQPLTVSVAIHYIRQIAQAVGVLHQHGLLHQDLRPQNIIQPLGKDTLVLTEFDLGSNLTDGSGQTQVNLLSTGYAPPEKYSLSAQLTPAADIYSLAATLYFLLVGQPPIPAPVRASYLEKSLHGNRGKIGDRLLTPTLRQARPRLNSAVELAIVRGLQVSPLERPQTVKSWLAILPRTQPPTISNSSERRAIAVDFDFGRRFGEQGTQKILDAIRANAQANTNESSAHQADDSTSATVVPIDRDLRAKEPTVVPELPPAVDLTPPEPELESTENDLEVATDRDFTVAERSIDLETQTSSAPVEPELKTIKPSLSLKTRSGNIFVILTDKKKPTVDLVPSLRDFSEAAISNSATPAPQNLEMKQPSASADGNIGSGSALKLEEAIATPAKQAEENNNPLPTPPLEAVVNQKPSQKPSGNGTKKLLLRSLIMTWAVAASAGIGFGLALRFNRPIVAGSTILHTDQSFPPRELWPIKEGQNSKDRLGKPIRN